MLAEERRSRILDVVNERGSVSVNDLHRRLKVSRETIRRDITKLAEEGRLRRTHGGALALSHSEPVFEDRMTQNAGGKRAIGLAAATLVADDMTVLIDSGTTTAYLAEGLAQRRRLTVYTNDIRIAQQLAGRNDNRVILTGGTYLSAESALTGADAVLMIRNYFPDIAFVGVSAVSSDPAIMDYTREGADMRAAMLAQAKTKIVLADHTKLERTAPVRILGLEEVDTFVTDVPLSPAMQKGFAGLSADVVIASEVDLDDGW